MRQAAQGMDKTVTTFRQSLAIQRRVIWALLMREVITRFGRENLGVLWLILEPMMFTLGVATLWSAAGMAHGSSIPLVLTILGILCRVASDARA